MRPSLFNTATPNTQPELRFERDPDDATGTGTSRLRLRFLCHKSRIRGDLPDAMVRRMPSWMLDQYRWWRYIHLTRPAANIPDNWEPETPTEWEGLVKAFSRVQPFTVVLCRDDRACAGPGEKYALDMLVQLLSPFNSKSNNPVPLVWEEGTSMGPYDGVFRCKGSNSSCRALPIMCKSARHIVLLPGGLDSVVDEECVSAQLHNGVFAQLQAVPQERRRDVLVLYAESPVVESAVVSTKKEFLLKIPAHRGLTVRLNSLQALTERYVKVSLGLSTKTLNLQETWSSAFQTATCAYELIASLREKFKLPPLDPWKTRDVSPRSERLAVAEFVNDLVAHIEKPTSGLPKNFWLGLLDDDASRWNVFPIFPQLPAVVLSAASMARWQRNDGRIKIACVPVDSSQESQYIRISDARAREAFPIDESEQLSARDLETSLVLRNIPHEERLLKMNLSPRVRSWGDPPRGKERYWIIYVGELETRRSSAGFALGQKRMLRVMVVKDMGSSGSDRRSRTVRFVSWFLLQLESSIAVFGEDNIPKTLPNTFDILM